MILSQYFYKMYMKGINWYKENTVIFKKNKYNLQLTVTYFFFSNL